MKIIVLLKINETTCVYHIQLEDTWKYSQINLNYVILYLCTV